MDVKRLILDICYNPKHTKWIAPLLLFADAMLCAIIIWKIPYTDIDWTTYMQQISLFLSGERNYPSIKGSTGPLVYPAAHVYLYTGLYYLTDEGRDILLGQIVFAILYLATLALVFACYRQSGVPPYLLPLLILSKRLHSIFVLRLFNDGFAAFALWLATYLLQRKKWVSAVVVWSLGVGIKMTLLLLAPAIAVILALSLPLAGCIRLGASAMIIQALLGLPFLLHNPAGYISRAFEFTRQFLFKWTVNWRFVGEETFVSREFSVALLMAHLSLLSLLFEMVWLRSSSRNTTKFIRDFVLGRHCTVTPASRSIMTAILTSLATGLLCARSLHYQFFAYLSWATPFLLWRAGLHPFLIYIVWAMQEWGWNIYPSTNTSSAVVVLSLIIQVLGILLNTNRAADDTRPAGREGVGSRNV